MPSKFAQLLMMDDLRFYGSWAECGEVLWIRLLPVRGVPSQVRMIELCRLVRNTNMGYVMFFEPTDAPCIETCTNISYKAFMNKWFRYKAGEDEQLAEEEIEEQLESDGFAIIETPPQSEPEVITISDEEMDAEFGYLDDLPMEQLEFML